MPDAHECLTAWRQAERLRDTIPRDSEDWAEAEREVRHARLVYQATVARTAARYQEAAAGSAPASWWVSLRSIRSSPTR